MQRKQAQSYDGILKLSEPYIDNFQMNIHKKLSIYGEGEPSVNTVATTTKLAPMIIDFSK